MFVDFLRATHANSLFKRKGLTAVSGRYGVMQVILKNGINTFIRVEPSNPYTLVGFIGAPINKRLTWSDYGICNSHTYDDSYDIVKIVYVK